MAEVAQYTPRVLIDAMRRNPRPQTFLKDFFIRTTPSFHDKSVIEFDKEILGQTAAPYISKYLDGNLVGKSTFDNQIHVAPYLHDYIPFTAEDLEVRNPGNMIYNEGAAQNLNTKVGKWMATLEDRFIRAEEKQVAEVLQTGKINVAGDGVSYEVDFQPSASNFYTLTGGDVWGSGTEDKLQLLQDICQHHREEGAVTPTVLVGGADAIGLLLADTDIQALLDNRRIMRGEQLFNQINDSNATFVGNIKGVGFDLDIYSYQGTYKVGSTSYRYLDTDKIILANPEQLELEMHYGMISNLKSGNFQGRRFPLMTIAPNGKKGQISLESSPFAVLKDVDSVSCIKVK